MRNLPATDVRYWATIVSACCIGETLGDYVSHGLNLGYGLGSVALFALFAVVLVVELRARVKNETRYWAAVVITSTTGTTLADFTSRSLKLGYGLASALLVTVLAVLFVLLRITSSRPASAKPPVLPEIDLDARKGERGGHVDVEAPHRHAFAADALYWLTILVVSTFGTTMGDFVSDGLGLGPGKGSLVLGAVLVAAIAADLLARQPSRVRYWIAIVITSTVGATFGDFLTKEDGLELGYGRGTAVLVAVFVAILVAGRVSARRRAGA